MLKCLYGLFGSHFPDIYIRQHGARRAGAVEDIVTEYDVRLGSFLIQMTIYLEKMNLI